MTATTALTAQNTQGVSDIHYIPSAFVSKQIDACFDDIGVDVVKIGMYQSPFLPSSPLIAPFLARYARFGLHSRCSCQRAREAWQAHMRA